MNLPECHEIVGIEADGLTKSGPVSEDAGAAVAGPEPQIKRGIGRLTTSPKAGAKGMHDDSRLTHGPTGKKGHFILGVEGKAVILVSRPHARAGKVLEPIQTSSYEGSAALSLCLQHVIPVSKWCP